MKKLTYTAACCAAAAVMLVGCAIPGIESGGSDNSMTDSYSYTPANEEEAKQGYSWIIEPSISADNIISFDGSQVDPDDEQNSAYANYSVIRQNGKYGLIDFKGNIVIQPEYDDYYTCWCGEVTLFNVIDEKNEKYEYCTVDSSKQIVDYVSDHTDNAPKYYWDAESKKIFVKNNNEEYGTEYTGKKTVVVGEAKIESAGNGYYDITPEENSLYGLAKKGKLLLDMVYFDYYAPSYKGAGLTCIALKDGEGKWGYVGSDGKTVVEFKCDGDMSTYNGSLIDDETKAHPFLFTGDYVPVSVNANYGYYDIEGNCIVRPGEFEQARPVHNGRAWVRQNGLWGVIKLGEIIEDEPTKYEDSSSKSETTTTKSSTSTSTSTTTTTSQSETAPSSQPVSNVTSIDTAGSSDNGSDSQPVSSDPIETDPPVTDPPVTDTNTPVVPTPPEPQPTEPEQ
ncbi:MAG: WG repeat-containing protein [Ruminococcus sp.]|nr:WG repeat-containing protein [Ruminococcus sp.]